MYAIVELKGEQFKTSLGDIIKAPVVDTPEGEDITIDTVLFYDNEGDVKIGKPYVEGLTVVGKVLNKKKDKKIIVQKYKNKISYKKTRGHRQQYASIRIEAIGDKKLEK